MVDSDGFKRLAEAALVAAYHLDYLRTLHARTTASDIAPPGVRGTDTPSITLGPLLPLDLPGYG